MVKKMVRHPKNQFTDLSLEKKRLEQLRQGHLTSHLTISGVQNVLMGRYKSHGTCTEIIQIQSDVETG